MHKYKYSNSAAANRMLSFVPAKISLAILLEYEEVIYCFKEVFPERKAAGAGELKALSCAHLD